MDERRRKQYIRLGAEFRILKVLLHYIRRDGISLFSPQGKSHILSISKRVDSFCSNTEDNMFKNNPGLAVEFIDIFYGASSGDARSDIDAEVLEEIKKITKEILGKE